MQEIKAHFAQQHVLLRFTEGEASVREPAGKAAGAEASGW